MLGVISHKTKKNKNHLNGIFQLTGNTWDNESHKQNLDCEILNRINDPVFSTKYNKKKEKGQGERLQIKEEK